MAEAKDKGAQEAPNVDTAKKMKRAARLEARLERIGFLMERADDAQKAELTKEVERREAELHYLKTTLDARLGA